MPKLFMLLLGCTPLERNTEQHDVFFGVGETIKDLLPAIQAFWPGANKLHIDAWRKVTNVDGHGVEVIAAKEDGQNNSLKLFFLNLGGYKETEFEEFHYKMIVAAPGKGEAINLAKQTAFFRHTGFNDANSHIDDKWGIDVDDIYEIHDILSIELKKNYRLLVNPVKDESLAEDEICLGYFKLSTL